MKPTYKNTQVHINQDQLRKVLANIRKLSNKELAETLKLSNKELAETLNNARRGILTARTTTHHKHTPHKTKGTSNCGKIEPRKTQSPPGSWIYCYAEFFYSQKTLDKVFEPLISDLRCEYFEALHQKRKWKTRWIRVRYSWAFVKIIGLIPFLNVIGKLLPTTKG